MKVWIITDRKDSSDDFGELGNSDDAVGSSEDGVEMVVARGQERGSGAAVLSASV